MPRLHRPALVAALAVGLAGCAGGGGDDSGNPGAPTFNAAAAYRNLLTTANTWTVTGTDTENVTSELSFTTVPGTAAVFPVTGISGRRSTFQSEIRTGGQLVGSNALTYYFNDATTGLIGVENDDQTCEVPVAVTALPVNAVSGQSGPVATLNPYNGCTPASTPVANAAYTLGWSIETDGVVSLFCLNAVRRNANNVVIGTESDCFETSTAGALGPKARITLTLPTLAPPYSLVAKNY